MKAPTLAVLSVLVRAVALGVAGLAAACPTNVGTFDGGIPPDAEPPRGPFITAADIGAACTYDLSSPGNPTNTCKQGLSCLIYTSDGSYAPFPPGAAQNMTLPVWENHFTRYRQDPVDEGQCTLLGSWQAPPACPPGTSLKLLARDLAVCMKPCQSAADCGRPGYVCDERYLDLSGGHCVRACTLDVPDCVRSGHVSFTQAGQNGQPAQGPPQFVLAVNDLAGESVCDVGSGMCAANPGGAQGPGEPCASSRDCVGGTACIQRDVLLSLDPNLPQTTTGFCAQPCKPDAQQQFFGGGCNEGYVCQAGFTFGHGNPLGTNPQGGFVVFDLNTGSSLQAGGFCFPDCQVNQSCTPYPGTQCGAADDGIFGFPWNNRSMCMIPALLQ